LPPGRNDVQISFLKFINPQNMDHSLIEVFQYLSDLKEHNSREWFQQNRDRYDHAHERMVAFADRLLEEMRKFDHIETVSGKKSLFRIYRDVRFSKDKKPYKTSWSGSFKRATKALRGGYYFHIEPGNTFLAGGFFGPNPEDLRHIRNQIDLEDEPLKEVLNARKLKEYFGKMIGEKVKTAPQGFSKDHPSIDLLKHKQFLLKHTFNDSEALLPDFYQSIARGFEKMLPFFNVMSEYLTTDLNGNSLI